jgi:hypothetical protein
MSKKKIDIDILDPIKPNFIVWVSTKQALNMDKGIYPKKIYLKRPKKDRKFVKIILTYDIFKYIWNNRNI